MMALFNKKGTHTLTRAVEAGNALRISKSSATGGIRRSPFLTAPLSKIGRAFGPERSLQITQPKF